MARQLRETFLTSGDVARMIGISQQRVIQLERSGRIEAAKTTTGIRLFRESTVQAEIQRRRKLK